MPPKIGSLAGPSSSSSSTYYLFIFKNSLFFPAYSSQFHGNLQIAIYNSKYSSQFHGNLQIAIYNTKYSSQFHGNLQIAIYNRKYGTLVILKVGNLNHQILKKT
jgi:hypothetical protein